ncbi:receptor-like protein 50 [Lycium barbarum]|uniref:receptor-like protein 50 n=1 Tax=Lycium barbarum TaxID=112863 RepID=UPI00293E0608|nr:receptor-like protein 50 [Lycium barbarum]
MRSQMVSQLFLILLISICCRMSYVVAANSSKCLQDQKMLLLQLRNNLTYDSEVSTKLVNWNERIDCCQWQGVTCNGAGQVISLDLTNELFSGSINPLANLKFLSVIRLDGNYLSAPIPEFFADFTNLTVLSLNSCNLIGEAPQKIFQVPTLQTIDLSVNEMLGGSLPEFPPNGSLQALRLSRTKFSGILPESIGNLKMLSHVELEACNFTGPIPTSMENLTHLVHLDFDWNSFSSSFPSFKLSKNLTFIRSARNKLTGISSDWEGFDNLEYLDLSNNSISGLIPASLFYLPSLTALVLSNNKFSGQITDLQNVTSPLEDIDLSANKLEGPIPEFIFELHGLFGLSLSSNKFNGTVQLKKFTEFDKLLSLDLSHNSLSVDTDISESEFSLLPQLNSFMLASCNLQNISFLKNQSKLSMLDLSNNQLTGEIPNWLVEINDGLLRFLNLSFNKFTHIQEPYTFGFLNYLNLHSNLLTGVIPLPPRAAAYIDFSDNNFATLIPPDFGNYLVTAQFLSIANNKVIGSIPSSICNSSYLEVLDLSNNSLHGTIPPCLAEKSSTLKVLNLGKNNFIGNIPEKFSYNCELESLDLSQNHLTGLLPRSLSNCTRLKVLNLGNNKIKDTFPCWLRDNSNLRVLVLRFNGFHGNIDCSRASSNWTSLQIMDLASNNLSGILPRGSLLELKALMVDPSLAYSRSDILHFGSQLGSVYYQDRVTVSLKGQNVELTKILLFFTSIDFSSNNFVGDIPETVGDLQLLYLLNISHNNLTGQIPSAIGNLKQLGSLDLSFNRLGGNIPEKLASLTSLSVLNLSYNELVGMIPRGNQIQTLEDAFIGNKGLCGFPLNITCKNNSAVTPPQQPELEEDRFISRTEIYVSVELGFVVGIGIIFIPLLLSKRWNHLYNKLVDRLILRIFQQQDQDGRTSKSSRVVSRKKAAGKSRGTR